MTHGQASAKPKAARHDLFVFPQVPATQLNVRRTADHGLEARAVFARNGAALVGKTRGKVMMREAHGKRGPGGLTVIRARSKREVRPRISRGVQAVALALITTPCITRIRDERRLATWSEYPMATLRGERHVQSVVLCDVLAPHAYARLARGDEKAVLEVMANQQEWLSGSPESAVVLSRLGQVTRVWHYDATTKTCTECLATVYSSSEATLGQINASS